MGLIKHVITNMPPAVLSHSLDIMLHVVTLHVGNDRGRGPRQWLILHGIGLDKHWSYTLARTASSVGLGKHWSYTLACTASSASGALRRDSVYYLRSLEGVCLLAALRPGNMLVYLRDGSAQTVVRAATLR